MRLAGSEMMALIDRAGLRGRLRENGNLELYESEAELAASQLGWDVREQAGIAYEHVRGDRLAELQPGLSPRFVAGTFVPGWKNVSDPKLFGKAIWAYAQSKGARFLQAKVTNAKQGHGGASVHLEDGTKIKTTHLVLMAGAWSRDLAKGFGDAVPLDTERGYNTTLPVGSFDVKRQLTFPVWVVRWNSAGSTCHQISRDLKPCLRRLPCFCRAFGQKAGDSGWAIGHPCRIPYRSSAGPRQAATSITASAMVISASRNRRQPGGLSVISSRGPRLQSTLNLSSHNVFGTDHHGKTFLLLRRRTHMR